MICHQPPIFTLERITHSSVLLLPDGNPRGLLVQPNSETFQLIRQNSQILQWFQHVQDDENQVTCSGDGDNLSTSTFSVFGSFDNTW
jgi:hypothetical protein